MRVFVRVRVCVVGGGCRANGTVFARDLANERADVMNPSGLQAAAAAVAADTGMELEVLRGDELHEKGLRLLAAVGQAATSV